MWRVKQTQVCLLEGIQPTCDNLYGFYMNKPSKNDLQFDFCYLDG
jgi:hypothetical protein